MRCIDADALLTDLNNIKYPGAPYVDAGIRIAVGKICDAQTIEPERKKGKGKWIPDNRPGGGFWVCSCCKFPSEAFAADKLYKYCPNCGAKMEGIKVTKNE